MLDTVLPTLEQSYGRESARKLTSAYESALLILSTGQPNRIPDRATRLAVVEAMIGEGRRNGFEVTPMTNAGVAAVADRSSVTVPGRKAPRSQG